MRYLPLWIPPVALLLCPSFAAAQAPPANRPQPDVLVLNNDERLIGHFVGSSGASLTFHSDMLGDLTIDWSKVKQLETQGQYAVLPKGAQLRPHQNTSNIPQGRLVVADQKITVTPQGASPSTVPVAEAGQVLQETTFQQQISPPHIGFTQDWTGTITAGASIVQATQTSRTITGEVSLVRAIPVETEFPPRNRTSFDFSGSEGHLSQPGTASIRTQIVHADAERDQYFTGARVYAFGAVAFDHNYSQGLTLQQSYGGGIGWTIIRNPDETLDIKGSAEYVRQEFRVAEANQNLIASNVAEDYLRKFKGGAVFTEQITMRPGWNVLSAWMATGDAALNLPVYKHFTFSISVLDTFLNNPPPGFKKNSLQATTGLSYTLK
ncbi:MAG TPA: DUF481 domain-containing protein [Bryobacteraceae bacterium]|nr:DUF481 domain-containing protein [Bryobacteraceae bacterium]